MSLGQAGCARGKLITLTRLVVSPPPPHTHTDAAVRTASDVIARHRTNGKPVCLRPPDRTRSLTERIRVNLCAHHRPPAECTYGVYTTLGRTEKILLKKKKKVSSIWLGRLLYQFLHERTAGLSDCNKGPLLHFIFSLEYERRNGIRKSTYLHFYIFGNLYISTNAPEVFTDKLLYFRILIFL